MELTLRRTMRGEDKKQSSMLMLLSPETRVSSTHPLRTIKKLADEALAKLSPVFDAMYAQGGRPSIPPERLLKSILLMALYTVRSERHFCEQLDGGSAPAHGRAKHPAQAPLQRGAIATWRRVATLGRAREPTSP